MTQIGQQRPTGLWVSIEVTRFFVFAWWQLSDAQVSWLHGMNTALDTPAPPQAYCGRPITPATAVPYIDWGQKSLFQSLRPFNL